MSNELEPNGRFWWLWHNKLFETTPLTGYSFINGSKRLIEVLFWYGVIIAFTCFTIYNLYDMITYYRSKPTKTEVRITSNAIDATLTNFTFKLRLPFAEISSVSPVLSWDTTRANSNPPSLSCIDDLTRDVKTASRDIAGCFPHYVTPLVTAYDRSFVLPSALEDSLNETYSSPIKLYAEKLDQVWKPTVVDNEVMTRDSAKYEEILKSASERFNDIMDETNDVNLLSPFLLLHAMSAPTALEDFGFLKLFNLSQFYSDVSPEQVLEAISFKLFNMAPVMLYKDYKESKIFLRRWELEFKGKAPLDDQVSEYTFNNVGESFVMEFQVQIPDNAKQFGMRIKPPKKLITFLFTVLHLGNWLWLTYDAKGLPHSKDIIKSMNLLTDCQVTDWEQISRIQTAITEEETTLASYFFGDLQRKAFYQRYIDPIMDYYSSQTELILDIGSGHIRMKPFFQYIHNLLPTGRIVSDTTDCTKMSLGDCLDQCQSNFTLDRCQCYPWNFFYMFAGSEHQICIEPCPGLDANLQKCLDGCEERLAHPCDKIMYRPEVLAQTTLSLNSENKQMLEKLDDFILDDKFDMFNFKIDIEQVFTHSKTLETYEMNFTKFLAEFGGLVEFWLGINIIGIIHAIVYCLKQCTHCEREHKTGATMRRMMTNEQIGPNTGEDPSATEDLPIKPSVPAATHMKCEIKIQHLQQQIEQMKNEMLLFRKEIVDVIEKQDRKR